MDYPLPRFHFQVQWGGTKIGFTRIRNLAMRNTPMELAHGATPQFSDTKSPTRVTYENFFLDRQVFKGDNEFFDWFKETRLFEEGGSTGSVFRRDITISLLGENHEPVFIWRIKNAYPVRLSYADLDAHSTEPMMETLEITCEGINVQTN